MRVRMMTAALATVMLTVALAGTARADAPAEVMRSISPKSDSGAAHGQAGGGKPNRSPNLVDHGGPIIPAAHLYAIWWGAPTDWPSDTHAQITNFLQNVGGSNYHKVAQQYMRGATMSATYNGEYVDTSSEPGSNLSTSQVSAEIQKVLNGAQPDPNGVYFLFAGTFKLTNFCAWHSGATVNGVGIAQAYMPNITGVAGCDPGNLYNANSFSQGTRAIANVTAHEFMEAITDKLINTYGWIDGSGAEVADKCAWQFSGPVTIGTTNWQLQKEWSNAVSGCVQS